jgi:CBS domain-containing protein
MIALLYRSGTRIGLIAKLVQQLNARLFERAWQLVAPPDLVANSCLFVMGSEGRGEQLLKTDQDNGLVLRDGYVPPPDLAGHLRALLGGAGVLSATRNARAHHGQQPRVAQAGQRVRPDARQWLMQPDGDSLMNLAIFMDAHAVCGDAALLEAVRAACEAGHRQRRHAGAVRRPSTPLAAAPAGGTACWASVTTNRRANLKKEGIFPLVHGVRSLALAHRLTATGTAERITALVAGGSSAPTWPRT